MNNIPARKRRTAEERRGEIMRAAITLFARQGFERTTTKEIAAEAGISEGTIYKYFASKQEILFSFIGPRAVAGIPAILDFHEGADDAKVIRELIEDRYQLWDRNRDIMRIVIGESLFNPDLAEGLDRMVTPAIAIIERYIGRRIADGAFRAVNPQVAARALVGQILAFFIKWNLLMPEGYQLVQSEELFSELSELFLQGICKSD